MCMEVSRKSDSIMSLRMGRLSRNPDEACDQHLFFDKSIEPVIIVSAKHGHRERCPLVGKYAALIKQEESNEQNLCLPNHKADHVTFGCASGGATEFNVIQNNCRTGQPQTSSKLLSATLRDSPPFCAKNCQQMSQSTCRISLVD